MFDNNVQYEITLTNNSGVDYREWQTGSSVAIGQTLVFTITGENLANTIMSNVAQHNALRGRTEIVANAVALGGSSGGGVALGETSSTAYRGDNGKIAYDHSLSQGNPHNTTTSDINEGTNLFFTESRVNQTVLTGLNTSTATPALATDQLLAAIGKLQAQINNIAPPVWVSAASIGTVHPSIAPADNFIELARINGMLWVRGSFKNTDAILYESQPQFLKINDIQYKVLHRNPTSTTMVNITPRNAENKTPTIAFRPYSICVDATSASTSNQYFIVMATTLAISSSFYHIPPTCLGELVIK